MERMADFIFSRVQFLQHVLVPSCDVLLLLHLFPGYLCLWGSTLHPMCLSPTLENYLFYELSMHKSSWLVAPKHRPNHWRGHALQGVPGSIVF